MSHENSETVQNEDGKWINISGNTGEILAPIHAFEATEYNSEPEATAAAEKRSTLFDVVPTSVEESPLTVEEVMALPDAEVETTETTETPEESPLTVEEVMALPDAEEPSVSRKVAYGAADEPMIGGSIMRAVETGWEALTEGKSWEQSRADVEAERKEELYTDFPEFRSGQYDADGAVLGGRVVTAAADPATFILPWTKAVKVGNLVRLSVIGEKTSKTSKVVGAVVSKVPLFTLGATTSAADYSLYSYMRDGNVDSTSLFYVTAAGGTLTIAVEPFAKFLIGKYQKKYGTGVTRDKLNKAESVEEVEKLLGTRAYNLLDTKQKKAMNEVFDFEYMRGLQQTLNRATNMVKERSLAAAEKLKIRKAVKSGKMSKSGAKRQIKQLDIKLNKLDTSVVDKRAKVVQQLAEDIHNNRALTSKVLSYTVRPMIGSSIGAGLGLVAGSDDDAITNMMYWGAALGLAQKGIQANKLLTSSEARAFSRTLHAEQLLLTAQMLKASTALTQVTRLKAGSTIARDFSDKMHHSFSTRGVKPLSVEERAATARNYWDIILRKEVLKQSTKEEQRIAVKNLRGFANKEELTPQIKQLTKDLRTYFDNFTAYNKDVDIKPKELLDNYFPREYSFDVIDAGLTNMLPKGHIAGSVFNGKSFEETVAQIYVRKDKINIKSARKKAAKFIVTLHNPDTSGVTNASNFKLSKVPYVRHLEQKRKLHGTIKIKGKTVQIEELLEPWLKGDIVEILGNMTKESTKAVEFSRTFGKNGVLIYKTLNQVRNHYDDIIAEIDKKTYGGKRKIAQYEFLKNREIKRIKGGVDAFFGVYGQKLDRGYNNAAAVVSLYNSTKMLEDVAVANLGDLVQPFIQGAKLKDVLKAWRNSSFKATTTDLRSEVEPGHIINMLGQDTLAAEARATAGILEDTGGIVRKWSDGFYRVTQLNNITSYARRFAFNVGAQDLFTIAKTNARNRAKVIRDTEIKHNVKWFDLTEAKQRQYLKEHPKAYDNQRLIEEGQYYGVSTKEMLAISKFDTFKEAYADKNLRALFESAGFRAMERDAKIPNVGNRLLFTQSRHPIMRLLGQFTSWAQAHSAKTNAMIKKIEDGNTKQAVRMIASLAVFHQIRQLRDIIKNGETDDDLTIPQHIARAAELSGAPGVWAGYYGSTLRATEGDYDFNPLTSFPAGRSTIDIWKQYEKEDNFADLIDQFQETGMSNGDAWNLLEDHYERVLPLPKLRGLIDEVFDNDEAAGFSKGGLVSQAERLGFNKGGAVSQEDITAVTDEWSKTPSDIGNAWEKRATSMQTTMQGARDSEIKPLQYAWNTASDIAGGVWDTGEEILEPVIDTVQLGAKATFPDAYAATAEALTDAGKQILDSDIGKKGLETAKDIYEWFQGFKKENPHDAKSIEGIGNLFPIAIGAKAVNKTLKNQMDTLNTKSTYQYKPNSDTPYLDMDNEKINKVNKFFNPDVINKALQSKDKNTKVVYMTPGEFLTLAKTHTSDGETKKLDRINNAINEGIQLEDIPTLTIKAGKDGNSQVTKHDGRHRANALYELGEDLIPVRVKTTGNKDNKKLSTVTNEDGLEVYTFPAYSSLIYDRHHLGTVESYDTKKPTEVLPITNKEAERDTALMTLLDDLPVGKQLVIDNSKDYYENDIDYNSAEWFENIARGSEVTVDGNNIIIKKIKEIKLGDIETAVVFPESGKVTIMIPQAGELILEKGGKYNNIEGEWSIETVGLSDEFKNKGLGVKLYLKAVEELLKKGDYAASYLSSGGMTTESAMRVWRSLYKNPDKYLKEFPQLKGTFSIHTNEKNMIVHDNGPKGEKQYEQDIDSEPAYSIELDPSAYEKNIIKRRTPKKPKAAMPAKKTQDPTLTIKVDDKQQSLERAPVGMGLEQMANDNIALVGGLRSGNSKGDETRLKYTVYDYKAIQANNDMDNANDYILGDVELFVEDGTGKVRGLVELNIKDKRKGTGRKVIEALMASDFVNDDFNIHSIKKSAIPFWEKMGIEFNNKRTIGDYRGDGILRKEDSVKKTKATMPAKKTQDPTITTKVVDKAMMPPKVSLVSRLPKKQKDFNLEQDNHDGTWSQGREYPGGEKSYERIKIPYKYDVKYKDGTRKPYELYNVGFDKKTKQYRVLKVRGDDQQVVSVSRDEFDSILKDTHPDLKVESVTKYY